MSRNLPHLFIRNQQGLSRKFDMSRKVDNDQVDPKPAESYRPQKDRLNLSYRRFDQERAARWRQRSLEVPANIDYVEIQFYIVFGDARIRSRFESEFGLAPVRYNDFNKTILFAISDEIKFRKFVDLLYQFIQSPDNIPPRGTDYSIISTVHDFQFLSREKIIGFCRNHLVLDLVNIHRNILNEYDQIKPALFGYLSTLQEEGRILGFQTDEDTSIEVHGINNEDLFRLADNFDILCTAHSLRIPRIQSDVFNAGKLSWGITIRSNPGGHRIGVLDNGVRMIEPLKDIVLSPGLDITARANPDATRAHHPHGTIVASLAAVGTQFFDASRNDFTADADIFPIKILADFDGIFHIYSLIEAIETAVKEHRVRIFNLSICAQGKRYNEPPSVLAYQLDRIAYNHDILIFIATGNLEEDDLQAMHSAAHRDHPFHHYPNHFYDPEELTDCHTCEATNICAPAESLNNMTVGAIADNLRDNTVHLTLSKELPAFYSRKNHYDYSRTVNETQIRQSQINRNISKPDIVMPGGDRINSAAGMQVFGFGEYGNDFYLLDSGTSLATPLAANLAAKIQNVYPDLDMQTVKALIINSATPALNHSFLESLEMRIKNRLSNKMFGGDFDQLSQGQKSKVSRGFNRKNLYRNLVGYGRPDETKILYSTDKIVTIVLEDYIESRTHRIVPIRIPEYLLNRMQSKRLYIKATLCFRTFPNWGNHLDYNPLHISFNLIRQLDGNVNRAAEIIANNRNDPFFEQFYHTEAIEAAIDAESVKGLKAEARKKAMGIKSKLDEWSEDYFPPVNKPYSNTQRLDIHIRKEEIEKVQGHIVLAIRCAVKENLSPAMEEWAQRQKDHPFSIVMTIEDETNLFEDFSLYDELVAINTLEPIVDLDAQAEAAEAEAEN